MSINAHDRERVIAVAEEFCRMIAEYEENDSVSDVTLDQFMIVGICGVTVVGAEDDDEVEIPVRASSTRRVFSQRGILETVLDRLRAPDGLIFHEEDSEGEIDGSE
jgi:hypothetical protein